MQHSDFKKHSVFNWKLMKQSRLSHMYEIQGSYFIFYTKNDPCGLEGPLVRTNTLSRKISKKDNKLKARMI